jgi:hypothetical protein
MVRKHIWKCLSLIVIALLIATWIANFFGQLGIGARSGPYYYQCAFRSGSLSISKQEYDSSAVQGIFWRANGRRGFSSLYANLYFGKPRSDLWSIAVPIILLTTAMIPIVVGTFSQFRFRLWQFFAFTTILGLELALFLYRLPEFLYWFPT